MPHFPLISKAHFGRPQHGAVAGEAKCYAPGRTMVNEGDHFWFAALLPSDLYGSFGRGARPHDERRADARLLSGFANQLAVAANDDRVCFHNSAGRVAEWLKAPDSKSDHRIRTIRSLSLTSLINI